MDLYSLEYQFHFTFQLPLGYHMWQYSTHNFELAMRNVQVSNCSVIRNISEEKCGYNVESLHKQTPILKTSINPIIIGKREKNGKTFLLRNKPFFHSIQHRLIVPPSYFFKGCIRFLEFIHSEVVNILVRIFSNYGICRFENHRFGGFK